MLSICGLLQEEQFSPARAGPDYAPVLTNALPTSRHTSPLGRSLGPFDSRQTPFGDLFGLGSSLPSVAVPNCPELPDWNHQRPYLTGQFLLDAQDAEESGSSRHQALESFSSAVQEIVGMHLQHCNAVATHGLGHEPKHWPHHLILVT